jgi:hypothetical protein
VVVKIGSGDPKAVEFRADDFDHRKDVCAVQNPASSTSVLAGG